MCDPVLIAAILEELGYFGEKKKRTRRMKPMMRESIK